MSARQPVSGRVVYLVSLFPCWSETFIVREIAELLRLGVDVHIVSLKHASERMVQSDAQTMLPRVMYPPRGLSGLGRALAQILRHPVASLSELVGLARGLWRHPVVLAKSAVVWWRTLGLAAQVQALRPQHLHAHWATYPSTAAMWLSGRSGIPFSFTAHAHDIFLEDHLIAQKLQRAAFGVTISDFNRRYLAEHVSTLALQRMRIVHCGVAPGAYAYQAEGRIPGRIVSVGRLDAIKGFEHLIEACAILQRRGVYFECRIIGEGPLRAALQARIDALGLGGHVQLLGACKQEQVREALNEASLFALACVVTPQGDRDGIPVALMEAMACGTPVVSTRVSGIPELIEHGVGGLLAEPGDARELARCIEGVLASPGRAQQMARAAREKIERDFDVSTEARKLHASFV